MMMQGCADKTGAEFMQSLRTWAVETWRDGCTRYARHGEFSVFSSCGLRKSSCTAGGMCLLLRGGCWEHTPPHPQLGYIKAGDKQASCINWNKST